MYRTEFICSYNLYNHSLNKSNPITSQYSETILNELIGDSEADLHEMSEYLYQDELLNAFDIENYDIIVINKTINELYIKIKENMTKL